MSHQAPPGPGAAIVDSPSSEDRMVAAVAYLSWFVGMYLVVPVGIFFWARDRSRFVTYHAIQATVLAMLMAVAAGISTVGYFFVIMLGAMIGVTVGAELAFLLGAAAFGLLVLVLPAIATLYSAWCAFHGDTWRIPLIGWISDRVLAASDDRMKGKP